MKILFVAAEVNPLVKVGGLADVVGSLPRVLRASGHDVRVMIPQYGRIDTARFKITPVMCDCEFDMLGQIQVFNLNLTTLKDVPVYTLENTGYFGTTEVYTSNDLDRFYFFSRAVCAILSRMEWQPDIIHCHDWHTALIPMWIRREGYPYSSVFTIHNLAYQGNFDESYLESHDLKKVWEDCPVEARPPNNFMSQGLIWSDFITTVSENYAREITTLELGMGLDSLLRRRLESFTGIVNGLNYKEWDPQTDAYLPVNYAPVNLKKRALNKIALQRVAGLPVGGDIPLIGMVQRLDGQKGIDLVGQAMEAIVQVTGAQIVILGKGWDNFESLLRQMAMRFPERVAAFIAFEEPLAHLIYAGSDMFLMPSRFEPCGLGQLIAMRYGSIPIVRHTGGLVDTVPKLSADLKKGNGFAFQEATPAALLTAIKTALEAFSGKKAWEQVVKRVSRIDFSWQVSARKYEAVYQRALKKSSLSHTQQQTGEN
jgi:starch synthase